MATIASRFLGTFLEKKTFFENSREVPLYSFEASLSFFPLLLLVLFSFPYLHRRLSGVTSWLSVGYKLVISDDQVESRLWWAAGGSSLTFVPESPDWCPR